MLSTSVSSIFSNKNSESLPVMTSHEYQTLYLKSDMRERLEQMQNSALAQKEITERSTKEVLVVMQKLKADMERERHVSEELEKALRNIIAVKNEEMLPRDQMPADKREIAIVAKNIFTTLQNLRARINNQHTAIEQELLHIVSSIQKDSCSTDTPKTEYPFEELFNTDILSLGDENLTATRLQYLESQKKLDKIENQLSIYESMLLVSQKNIIAANQRLLEIMVTARKTSEALEQKMGEIVACETAVNTVNEFSQEHKEPLLLGRKRKTRPSEENAQVVQKETIRKRFGRG